MKAFTCLILAIIIVSISIIAPPTVAYSESSVGVKKGDWMEYTVSITGPTWAPSHNISWFRIEILDVTGAAFQANVTVRNVNGTFDSSVWEFNFTDGQVGGWVIIPSNLSVGDTFFDCSIPAYVAIESEEQKVVAGASRTITTAHDSIRLVKEWEKTTGIYTYSLERPKNFTVISNAIGTNMWNAQVMGLNQTVVYGLVATIILLAVLILFSTMFIARRKRAERLALLFPSQGKIAVLTIILLVLLEVAVITIFPFYGLGLSFAEINLIMQTFWTALLLVSMWFRMRGNYFVHELTMLIVMCPLLVGFSAVLLMSPLSSSSLESFASTPLRIVMNSLHAIFSIPAIVFGVWLVALWRPKSPSFAAKSKRIALLTTVFWIPSYVVGVLDFLALHTTLFG